MFSSQPLQTKPQKQSLMVLHFIQPASSLSLTFCLRFCSVFIIGPHLLGTVNLWNSCLRFVSINCLPACMVEDLCTVCVKRNHRHGSGSNNKLHSGFRFKINVYHGKITENYNFKCYFNTSN